jgi:hypothetical protein
LRQVGAQTGSSNDSPGPGHPQRMQRSGKSASVCASKLTSIVIATHAIPPRAPQSFGQSLPK